MINNQTKLEQLLFETSNKLRMNIYEGVYKNVAFVFLRYILESFEGLYQKIYSDDTSDPKDRYEYTEEKILPIAEKALCANTQSKAEMVMGSS
jgi:type I restriction-modification system DNA methylase subunit